MKRRTAAKKTTAKKANGTVNALDLLMEDHAKVQAIFKKYKTLMKKDGSDEEKMELVKQACEALAVHAQIEEEIFYPAIRDAVEPSLLAEAFVEHDGAKELIEQLQDMDAGEALFDAKFIVLGEQVKHHIEEEETKIFPKLRRAGLDLVAIGEELKDMKEQLEPETDFPHMSIPREEAPAYVE